MSAVSLVLQQLLGGLAGLLLGWVLCFWLPERRHRRRAVDRLRAAATPPVCPRCGMAAYFHHCEVWAEQVRRERDARERD